jgi:hypothetical protein
MRAYRPAGLGKIVDPATHAKLTHSSGESLLELDNSLIERQFP